MHASIRVVAALAAVTFGLIQATGSDSAGESRQPAATESHQPAAAASQQSARSGSVQSASSDSQRTESQDSGGASTARPAVNVKVSVYEVLLTPTSELLTRMTSLREVAGDESDFAKMLGELGTARRVVDIDRPADLNDEYKVSLGSSVPIIQSTGQAAGGGTVSSVSYQEVGAALTFSNALFDESGSSLSAEVDLELASSSESSIRISTDKMAPVFSNWKSKTRMRFDLGAPLVTFEFSDWTADVPARVIVVRYLLTPL